MKKIFLYISALLAGAACTAQETLLSPDGRLRRSEEHTSELQSLV